LDLQLGNSGSALLHGKPGGGLMHILISTNLIPFQVQTGSRIQPRCCLGPLPLPPRAARGRCSGPPFRQGPPSAGLTNGQFSLLMPLNRPELAPMGTSSIFSRSNSSMSAAIHPFIVDSTWERSGCASDHSTRNARIGSTLTARLAGTTLATRATAVTPTAANKYVAASSG
jgi:hypothetical protein